MNPMYTLKYSFENVPKDENDLSKELQFKHFLGDQFQKNYVCDVF